MTVGKLIGVSLGPGDPGLITRRAWDCLTSDACWSWPVRKLSAESYALSIALAAGLSPPPDGMALVFPMTHDQTILQRYWQSAAANALKVLQGGRDLLFLVEGDASTYSTFGHLANAVRDIQPDIDIETLPGVPAYLAASARLQQPLAEVDDTVAVIPAAYGVDVIDRLLDDFDTLVLLKVKPQLVNIIPLLRQRKLLEHSRFVEKAGAKDERIIDDVAQLEEQKVNYLSLLIVKNPSRVKGPRLRGCRKKPRSTVSTSDAIVSSPQEL